MQLSDGGSTQTMDNFSQLSPKTVPAIPPGELVRTIDGFFGLPTKISFSWKEIDEVGHKTAIWGEGDELPDLGSANWAPVIVTGR